jgi:hypothetical protein
LNIIPETIPARKYFTSDFLYRNKNHTNTDKGIIRFGFQYDLARAIVMGERAYTKVERSATPLFLRISFDKRKKKGIDKKVNAIFM